MILVDTSVWIDFFNQVDSRQSSHLNELIKLERDLCLADINLTEILQGVKEEKVFNQIKRYLLTFAILRSKNLDTYIYAASISQLCRQKGNPVYKTVDTLISSIAIENNVEIFHKDKDFDTIARYTSLKIYKWS